MKFNGKDMGPGRAIAHRGSHRPGEHRVRDTIFLPPQGPDHGKPGPKPKEKKAPAARARARLIRSGAT